MRKFWQRKPKPKPPSFDVRAAQARNIAMQAQLPALVGMALKLMIQTITTPAPEPVQKGNLIIIRARLGMVEMLAKRLKIQEATLAELAMKGGNDG